MLAGTARKVAKSTRLCSYTGVPCTWVKRDDLAVFSCFVSYHLEDTVYQDLGHTQHPKSATFSCFPCWYPGALSPEMPIFTANAKLSNRPGFALPPVHYGCMGMCSGDDHSHYEHLQVHCYFFSRKVLQGVLHNCCSVVLWKIGFWPQSTHPDNPYPLGWRSECATKQVALDIPPPQSRGWTSTSLTKRCLYRISPSKNVKNVTKCSQDSLSFPSPAPIFSEVPKTLPKGPFRTKNTTALNSVVFYYCSSFLQSVAICCLLSLKTSGFKVSAVVFYYRRSEFTLRSKFTIRSIFSTGGSFR